MSSVLRVAKEKYATNRYDACRAASLTMSEVLELPINISEWSGRARIHLGQWEGTTKFDWPEVFRRHNQPDRLDMAVWSGERLCALAIGLPTGQAINLRFLEGDPRQDCPLRGHRIPIALEATANYAQLRGKKEIRIEPINDKLVKLYEEVYGFELVKPRNETPYYRKGV